MQFLCDYDEVELGGGAALMAVHSAISLSDAIMIAGTGKRCSAQNHKEAVRLLRRICGKVHVNQDGISHFEWLVGRKDDFAYGDRRVDIEKDIKPARLHAERFAAWAYRTFPALGGGN